jgi:hypothetical protein
MVTPKIVLPYQFNALTVSQVAAEVAAHAKRGWPEEVIFDFRELAFVRPAGVAFLSNLIRWLHNCGTRVSFDGVSAQTAALSFLDDALFFEQHCGAKLNPGSSPRSTTQPLRQIAHQDCHAWLQQRFVPWLAGRLEVTPPSLYPFKVCLSELFNNIQDHTRFDIGTLFAQHFPNENNVFVAISDFGDGIPEKVRTKLPELGDRQAIIKATEDGFTTKSEPGNRGAGLDYLLRVVVAGHGGKVTICSSNAMVRFERIRNQITPITLTKVGFCPGTTIDIELRTDTIVSLPDEPENLEW